LAKSCQQGVPRSFLSGRAMPSAGTYSEIAIDMVRCAFGVQVNAMLAVLPAFQKGNA
jgi:hypothetical protein